MKTAALLSALIGVSVLSACGGTMNGVVRGQGTPVQFNYEQGTNRDFYTAVIGNENFKGQAVFADARSGFGVGFGAGGAVPVFATSTSGNMIATMFGDKGSTMRCQMNYADSSGFTSFGGVGVCQHSDGRIIDVMW